MMTLSHAFVLLFVLVLAPNIAVAYEITLLSPNNQKVNVDSEVAKQSVTLKDMMEDFGSGHRDIPVPQVSGQTLQRVVDFMEDEFIKKKSTDSQQVVNKRVYDKWGSLSPQDTLELVEAVNFLDLRSNRKDDVLRAVGKIYGNRMFHPRVLDAVAKKNDQEYATYKAKFLDVPQDYAQFIIEESLGSIDRLFVNNTRDRRIEALKKTSLAVGQVIAYIAAHNTPSMSHLPKTFQETLKAAGFGERGGSAGKTGKTVLFGPMPLEWAIWPSHCPLPSKPDYDMYSDSNPDDRYIDNGDGTVTDICTKLTWEQTPFSKAFNNANEAKNHCKELSKGGLNDWSAPTAIESQTLVDYTKQDPTMNAIFHNGSQSFWQIPQGATTELYMLRRDFSKGDTRAVPAYVRCLLRPGLRADVNIAVEPMEHYTTTAETALDNFTGKQWMREVSPKVKNHKEAGDYCTQLVLDHSKDWRVPGIKELGTIAIVDGHMRKWSTNREVFPVLKKLITGLWSKTPVAGDQEHVWLMHNDFEERAIPENVALVRCVR